MHRTPTKEIIPEIGESLQLIVNNSDGSPESNEIIQIRRVLWNEIELDSLLNLEALFPISIILYHDGILSDTDFKVLMNMLIRGEIIDSAQICNFLYTFNIFWNSTFKMFIWIWSYYYFVHIFYLISILSPKNFGSVLNISISKNAFILDNISLDLYLIIHK